MNFTLNTFIERDKKSINLNDFYPAAIEGTTFRGDIKGPPFAQAYTAVFYEVLDTLIQKVNQTIVENLKKISKQNISGSWNNPAPDYK